MSLTPLSLSNLLTTKYDIVLSPPGNFNEPFTFSRRYWKRVQHLTNEFWSRWRKEFLSSLQERLKLNSIKRDFKVDTIVIIKDEGVTRNEWPLGRIVNVHKGKDDRVRALTIRTKKNKVQRTITKIVLLLPEDSPPRDQDTNLGS